MSVNSTSTDNNLRIICREFGDPLRVLNAESADLTPIGPSQIRVKLRLAPINPSDLIAVWGNYSHRVDLPLVSGYEGVGTVVDIGAAVSRDLLGKRVLPLRGEGTWQRFVLSPAEFAVAIPDELSDIVAAQLYINPLTAWVICRYQFAIQSGETLVINAAGSAIGRIFIQLSQILGFRVIAVLRNPIHKAALESLGAVAVLDDDRLSVERIKQLTGGCGADYAIDLVGGECGTRLAFSLKNRGRFMALGLFSGCQVDWKKIHQALTIKAEMFHLRLWNQKIDVERWQYEFSRLIHLVTSGQLIIPPRGEIFALEDFRASIKASMRNDRIGKLFLSGED